MFRIRTGFIADPDPAFYLNADPNQEAKSLRIHADPDPGQPLQKVGFLQEKYGILYR
jgi:hypothetical protein